MTNWLMNEAMDGTSNSGSGGGTADTWRAAAGTGGGGASSLAGTPAAVQISAPSTTGAGQGFVTDGVFSRGFSANLPEDLKPYQGTLQKFEGVPVKDVLKSYGALEQKLGHRVQMPGADAKPEDVAAWRRITGAPDSPQGYKIERPNDVPEGAWSADLANGFAQIAHKHHLPPAAVQEVVGWWNAQQRTLGEQYAHQAQMQEHAVVDELRREWGQSFENNINAARRAALTAGLDPADPEIGNNPALIRALHRMAGLISEDREISGGRGGPGLSGGQQADDIQTNPENAWYADYHGKHGAERQRAAQQRVMALRQSGGR